MKNTIMIVLTIIFAVAIGAIIIYIPLRQREMNLAQKASTLKTENDNLKERVKDFTSKESQKILTQKQKDQENAKAGLAYFTSTVTPLNKDEKQVDVYLKGNTTVDAVDLVLNHKESVTVKEIKKGTVFVSYPRLLDKDGVITITGIAMPQGNSFVYGKTNEIYATLILETKGGASLDLNTKDTQAYFNGTPVLDFTSSFKNISL